MATFDISTFLDYDPPVHLCVKCCAINEPSFVDRYQRLCCRVCSLEYLPTSNCSLHQFRGFLDLHNTRLQWENPISHAKALASIARSFRSRCKQTAEERASEFSGTVPPLKTLLMTLLEAKHFVHIVSYGISHQFIGALKTISQRVPVRAVITNADQASVSELSEFSEEAPQLEARVFGEAKERHTLRDVPHQKLIVVDGLLAFKGSANLTLSGWRKADKGLDVVEVETNVTEVTRLHNALFSPVWADSSTLGATVDMETIPF